MKILSAAQIRALDAYTITQEPIASIDLMERASKAFVQAFLVLFSDKTVPVYIFCGNGNNGGDGFAVARLLTEQHYQVQVWRIAGGKQSADCEQNQQHWQGSLNIIHKTEDFPNIPPNVILIDALFGSGLSRPLSGLAEHLVVYFNQQENYHKVALDIASGLYADRPREGESLKVQYTISFELPKLAFFSPENAEFVGQWQVVPIGLSRSYIAELESDFILLTPKYFEGILKSRTKYTHKGTYGHALMLLGSYGKVGAALLAANACLRAGVGLLTLHLPACAYQIMQTALPEAMVLTDKGEHYLETLPDLSNKSYQAIAIGCGIDQKPQTLHLLRELLSQTKLPLVLDADALNLIATNPDLRKKISQNSILTPHPKEFSRLIGTSTRNHLERLIALRNFAQEYQVFILLKGSHTAIATPQGKIFFNTTGNPGMATAGSGDVLTGIITGLLAQGFDAQTAVLGGVYWHGLAGDFATQKVGETSVIASDIIASMGQALEFLKRQIYE